MSYINMSRWGLTQQIGPWRDLPSDVLQRRLKSDRRVGGGTFIGGTVSPRGVSVITPHVMIPAKTPIGLLNPSVYALNGIIRPPIKSGTRRQNITGRNRIRKIKSGLRPEDTFSPSGLETLFRKIQNEDIVMADFTNQQRQRHSTDAGSPSGESVQPMSISSGDLAADNRLASYRELYHNQVGSLTTEFPEIVIGDMMSSVDERPSITGARTGAMPMSPEESDSASTNPNIATPVVPVEQGSTRPPQPITPHRVVRQRAVHRFGTFGLVDTSSDNSIDRVHSQLIRHENQERQRARNANPDFDISGDSGYTS